MSFKCLFFLLLCYFSCCCTAASVDIYVLDGSKLTADEILLAESISGLYAQQTNLPSIWIAFKGWSMNDFWLANLQQLSNNSNNNHIIYNNSFQGLNGLIQLTQHLLMTSESFQVHGYLKADAQTRSLHYAFSLAFHYQAIVATDNAIINALQSSPLNLQLSKDFTADSSSYIAMYNTFLSYNGNNRDFVVFQELSKAAYLSGFAIATKSFLFFESNMKSSTVQHIFSDLSASNNVRLLGWGDSEFSLVDISSKYNISVVAADWAENMVVFYTFHSSLTGMDLNHKQRQQIPSSSSVAHESGSSAEVGVAAMPDADADTAVDADDYHYVTFLWTDGDNLQWLINGFFEQQWYGSSMRGQFPVGWTVSGSVQQLTPAVYYTIMNNATARDSFAMAPSGWGYEYINDCSDVSSFAVRTANASKISSSGGSPSVLANVNFIDDWNNIHSYSKNVDVFLNTRVTRNGQVFAVSDNIQSVLYYWYSDYAGGKGAIFWSAIADENKFIPVITARALFWQGFNNYTAMAELLNKQAIDPTDASGYSLIPIHAWSENMANVSQCIHLLQPHVKVVGLQEFVQRITDNVVH